MTVVSGIVILRPPKDLAVLPGNNNCLYLVNQPEFIIQKWI
jgi:hypothetical protein